MVLAVVLVFLLEYFPPLLCFTSNLRSTWNNSVVRKLSAKHASLQSISFSRLLCPLSPDPSSLTWSVVTASNRSPHFHFSSKMKTRSCDCPLSQTPPWLSWLRKPCLHFPRLLLTSLFRPHCMRGTKATLVTVGLCASCLLCLQWPFPDVC